MNRNTKIENSDIYNEKKSNSRSVKASNKISES